MWCLFSEVHVVFGLKYEILLFEYLKMNCGVMKKTSWSIISIFHTSAKELTEGGSCFFKEVKMSFPDISGLK